VSAVGASGSFERQAAKKGLRFSPGALRELGERPDPFPVRSTVSLENDVHGAPDTVLDQQFRGPESLLNIQVVRNDRLAPRMQLAWPNTAKDHDDVGRSRLLPINTGDEAYATGDVGLS
jgi:hypothetical protein